jgi:hypothetical protein
VEISNPIGRAVRKAAEAPKGAAVDVVRPEKHKVLLERLALLEGEVRRDSSIPRFMQESH